MSDPRRSDDVQVVLSMHPSRVQEFAVWLRNNSAPGSRASDYAEQIGVQGHGARLVVIDPEDREQAERLRQTMSLLGYERGDCAEDLQAVIRAMIAPPKPDEPTGLGAVVEDAVGEWWVQFTSKTGKWWRNHQGVNRRWSDLNAAKVLSEGVTP